MIAALIVVVVLAGMGATGTSIGDIYNATINSPLSRWPGNAHWSRARTAVAAVHSIPPHAKAMHAIMEAAQVVSRRLGVMPG